jgi:predicted ArsR family transcriptional regulator
MKTARQRILEYIQTQRAVTTLELCQALKTTEANVRHHLDILTGQGLVQVIGKRPSAGKGRPARIYGPSEQSLGNHLDLLAEALLEEILPALDPDQRQALLERLARRIEAALGAVKAEQPPAGRADHLTARLYAVVQRLNAAYYQARWEARPDGPRLILGHCPFGALAVRHPEICRMDAKLLEGLLGGPVEQLKRLAKDGRGSTYCLFHILPANTGET